MADWQLPNPYYLNTLAHPSCLLHWLSSTEKRIIMLYVMFSICIPCLRRQPALFVTFHQLLFCDRFTTMILSRLFQVSFKSYAELEVTRANAHLIKIYNNSPSQIGRNGMPSTRSYNNFIILRARGYYVEICSKSNFGELVHRRACIIKYDLWLCL